MNSKVIGLTALSGALMAAAMSGQVQPQIFLESGETVRSWSAAESSPYEVADVAPSAGGWLKLLLGAASIATSIAAIRESEDAEADDEMLRQQRAIAINQQRVTSEIRAEKALEAAASVEQVKAEHEAEQSLVQYLGVPTLPIPQAVPAQNQPAIAQPEAQRQPQVTQALASMTMPKSEFVTHSPRPEARDIPREFAENPKTALIIGVPGAGKGMFIANAVRNLLANRPGIKIFGIDPKGDDKEKGYWSDGYHRVFRTQAVEMSDAAFLTWLKNAIDEFKKYKGEKLLVLDEVTSTFSRWGRVDQNGFNKFSEYLTHIASGGDSLGHYIWAIGQIANASDLNMSGGIRSLFKPIAIISNGDRRASDQLLSTKFVPKPAGGKDAVFQMCDRSKVGRAIYDYMSDGWCPMPVLHNFSGFDRDSRTFVGGQPAEESHSDEPLTNDDRAVSDGAEVTRDQVLSSYKKHGKIGPVLMELWGAHPESDEWAIAKEKCKKLLGF